MPKIDLQLLKKQQCINKYKDLLNMETLKLHVYQIHNLIYFGNN